MTEKTSRIPYISLLQAVGIILVILGHATRIFYFPGGWYYHVPNVQSDFFNALTRIIYTFHMPLFIFLSGYLCENALTKNSSIKDFIRKRLKRLFIPFWGWGLLYSVPIWIYLQFPNANYRTFVTGQVMGHLWFLPLLLEVTLIYLILRLIPKKFNLIIFVGLIALQFLNYKRAGCFAIFRIPEFLTYFYLGAKFFDFEKNKIFFNKKIIYILTIILLSSFIYVEYLLYQNCFKGSLRIILAGLLGVISLVLLCKIIIENCSNIANNKFVQFLSQNLLNIFLIHEPLLEIILKYINWGSQYTPVITTLILFFGTLILTSIFVIIINSIWLFIKNKKKDFYAEYYTNN